LTTESQVITTDNTAPRLRKKAKTTHTSTILTSVKDAASTSLSVVHDDDAIPLLLIHNGSLLQQKQPSSSLSLEEEPLPPKIRMYH
jgi:hypothetical protein